MTNSSKLTVRRRRRLNSANIRVYRTNDAGTGFRYEAQDSAGKLIGGCAETALSGSEGSRRSALMAVVRCVEDTGRFDRVSLPTELTEL